MKDGLYVSLGQVSQQGRSCLAPVDACVSGTRVEGLRVSYDMSLILDIRGTSTQIEGYLSHQLKV
jgi:hypothetical protein